MMPPAISPAVPTMLMLRALMHAADVVVVQLVEVQSERASTPVTVASTGAKFMPVSVTLAAAEATLYGDEEDRTGAKRVASKIEIRNGTRCDTIANQSKPYRRS